MMDDVVVADVGLKQLEVGTESVTTEGVDQEVVANCRHNAPVCHIDGRYGHEKLLPDSNISRMSVSIGVFPTSRTKNNCSITCLRKLSYIHKYNNL